MNTNGTQTPQALEPESYIVLNEHSLGIVVTPNMMEVLASNVLKGGHNPLNGAVSVNAAIDQTRPATLADFKDYRLSPRGHLYPI